MKSLDRLTFVAASVLLLVFGLVVFHAPLSVFFSQFLPESIIKAWKEILLILVVPLVVFLLQRADLLKKLSRDLLLQVIAAYILLHILLVLLIDTNQYQKLAGLAIDLRYIVFFVLVYAIIILAPSLRALFLKVGAVAAGLSLSFAALQATVLPHDILKYLGYSKDTIEPYLTVDKNNDYIRINGTFRGPNPLGAYAVIFLSLVLSFFLKRKQTFMKHKWQTALFVLFALLALWASYSRSALLALGVSIVVILSLVFVKNIKLRYWFVLLIIAATLAASAISMRDSSFIQNVVLHNNPNGGSSVDSNDGHITSLENGVEQVILHPYGSGIGSAGSASLKSDYPNIVENQYLFIAHETGWLGLGLFIVICEIILWRLYQTRRDWLSLGVFASGIGLLVIGLLLPVLADDSISLIWFGLAAVALASHYKVGKK
ncbi:MAG: O-antigen ligase family protein [Candidatus Saccharibacteria bacterium]|nr:O-antigen ligase family protein [Candidatus Saccharibacteria bacterium]